MSKVLAMESAEGFELGYHLARFVDAEEANGKLANGSERCATCAFRQGTYPNGTVPAVMNAIKCAIEGKPFLCHEEDKPCSGWVLMRRASEGSRGTAPWDYTEGADNA